MNLDKITSIYPTVNGATVHVGGMYCMEVTDIGGEYAWRINPAFCKLTYGANSVTEVPFCMETGDSVESAVADALLKLEELGAFAGMIELPDDTNATINESAGSMLNQFHVLKDHGKDKAGNHVYTTGFQNKKGGMNYYTHLVSGNLAFPSKAFDTEEEAKDHSESHLELDTPVEKRKGFSVPAELNESDLLATIMDDCRVEAAKVSDDIMEIHAQALALYDSIVSEMYATPVKKPKKNSLKAEMAKKSKAYWDKQPVIEPKDNMVGNAKVVKESEINEAAYGKDDLGYLDAKAKRQKLEDERKKLGIKSPEEIEAEEGKRGRGRPTSNNLETIKAKMMANKNAGRRLFTGMERHEKVYAQRANLHNHPDFEGAHVSKAGRPKGTSAAEVDARVTTKAPETKTFRANNPFGL